MNRKNMPLLLMLIAGACTCIITLVRSYSVIASMLARFAVMQEAKAEEAAATEEDAGQKGVSESNG